MDHANAQPGPVARPRVLKRELLVLALLVANLLGEGVQLQDGQHLKLCVSSLSSQARQLQTRTQLYQSLLRGHGSNGEF